MIDFVIVIGILWFLFVGVIVTVFYGFGEGTKGIRKDGKESTTRKNYIV
tara:strand:+ start:822 stop:968 length:147 start_codon:yes stop_codon:yes gene_type:complete